MLTNSMACASARLFGSCSEKHSVFWVAKNPYRNIVVTKSFSAHAESNLIGIGEVTKVGSCVLNATVE
jgi:hypothetical protein